MTDVVRLPGDAFDPELGDVAAPTTQLLERLYLLPKPGDIEKNRGVQGAFKSPPESVVVIESGATALTKVWATGLGGVLGTTWVAVRAFYDGNTPATQRVLLGGAAIVSVALVFAIAAVISADLRGRAAGTVATIEARRHIATTILGVAQKKDAADGAPDDDQSAIVPLPDGRRITYLNRGTNEGWLAIAFEASTDASKIRWLIVKDGTQLWASATEVQFVS